MGNSKVILQKSHKAFDNKELAQGVENGEKQRIPNEVRPTMDGLLVGEVLSEIENKEVILMLWNKYRYAIVVDIFWLLIFLGLAKLFFSEKLVEILNIIKAANVHINNFYIGYNLRIAFLIFVFWPFLNFVYRKIYSVMEK